MQSVVRCGLNWLACVSLAAGVANAQFGREAVWMTAGSNAQRSSWVRSDAAIARDKIAPDFQFLWRAQLDKPGYGAPTEPIVMERYIGYRGFRSLAFTGSVADSVYAVDTDLNRIEWQKHIAVSNQQQSVSNCAASMGASVTLPTGTEFPSGLASGGGFGRGGVAKSGVGEPYQGAVTLAPAAAAVTRVPAFPRPARPRVREPIVLYTLTSDGMLHALYVSNGEEWGQPVKFVPPTTAVHGLIIVQHVAYAVAGQNCSAPDAVFALDLETKEVASWTADGAVIGGSEGAAFGPDGTLYVATGKGSSTYASSVVALDGKTLKVKDWYTVPGAEFTSTPVIFQYRNKVLLAAATKDGGLHLLNAASLGGADHQTPTAKTAESVVGKAFNPGALALWQDARFTHWLLASTDAGVAAWKIVDDEHGVPALERGWVSKDITSPMPPLIVNGVAFTASSGRVTNNRHAPPSVLYALDAGTGQQLWNSKETISSSAAAISAGAGRVYVTAHDGALYAFGFPMEH